VRAPHPCWTYWTKDHPIRNPAVTQLPGREQFGIRLGGRHDFPPQILLLICLQPLAQRPDSFRIPLAQRMATKRHPSSTVLLN
jgi:hypothetical protein